MMVGLGVGAAILGGAAHGAFHRNSWLFGKPITQLDRSTRAVALTFDDGPNPDATPVVLDALAARAVKATISVLWRHAERWPQLVESIADEGHSISNNAYDQ